MDKGEQFDIYCHICNTKYALTMDDDFYFCYKSCYSDFCKSCFDNSVVSCLNCDINGLIQLGDVCNSFDDNYCCKCILKDIKPKVKEILPIIEDLKCIVLDYLY